MTQEIRRWLNGKRAFADGLKLLQQIDPKAAEQCARIADSVLLFNALRSHLATPPVRVPSIAKTTTASTNHPKQTAVGEPDCEAAQKAKREANRLYKEMSNKRALLFDLCPSKPTPFENDAHKVAQRSELTKEVMRLQYEVDKAYDAYHFARINGRLPEEAKPEPIQGDMYRLITNCRKYISKLRRLEDPTPKQQARLAEKELELQYLLQEYDRLLNS